MARLDDAAARAGAPGGILSTELHVELLQDTTCWRERPRTSRFGARVFVGAGSAEQASLGGAELLVGEDALPV